MPTAPGRSETFLTASAVIVVVGNLLAVATPLAGLLMAAFAM